ncbi:trigger factor [Desulfitobacterium sp. PCE1]|uniref:trigger factor n=1 Tax=Desulfitobacterium sp. PCE1 TaxID=146907 RepID=UPI0003636A5E|nr:trigger factor [Desulfitobacterium sp. PCE1]
MHKFLIGPYKELKLKPLPEFTEDDLNRAVIESTLKLLNEWSKKNKLAEIGDEVIINLNPVCDGIFVPELAKSNFKYTVGDPSMLEQFKNVIHCKAGDSFKMDILFPESAPLERISGKTVTFDADVLEVINHSQQLESSDEIARLIDPAVSSMEELKNNLRGIIADNWSQVIAESKLEMIFEEILAYSEYEFDEEEFKKVYEDILVKTRQSIISSENLSMMPSLLSEDDEYFYEDCKILTEKTILRKLILDEIAYLETIGVTDDEIQEEKKRLLNLAADQTAFYKQFPDEESIGNNLVEEKVAKLLLEWNNK